jgi:hypothetical protein
MLGRGSAARRVNAAASSVARCPTVGWHGRGIDPSHRGILRQAVPILELLYEGRTVRLASRTATAPLNVEPDQPLFSPAAVH